MYQNENLHLSSITLIMTRNHQLTLIAFLGRLQIPQYMKILIYIGCINANAVFMQFHVILPDIL